MNISNNTRRSRKSISIHFEYRQKTLYSDFFCRDCLKTGFTYHTSTLVFFFTVNRRFLEFKTRKSRELLGGKATNLKRTRPSRRELLAAERSRKATNEKSFQNLVNRQKRENEELLKAHGTYTPLLPIISEETSLLPTNTDDSADDVMSSARSLPLLNKTPLNAFSESRDDVTCACDAKQSSWTRVVTKDSQSGLFLAKSFVRNDSATTDNNNKHNNNSNTPTTPDFNHYKKLPPIARHK